MHGNKKQYWINMKATTSWPKLFTLKDQVKKKKKKSYWQTEKVLLFAKI